MIVSCDRHAGFVDRACARLAAAGFDEAMHAALLAEPVLGADESPVNVLHPDGRLLARPRVRDDQAVAFGIAHNRHRDWHVRTGRHRVA